ncbi:NeuD/PglB/VioB family sugar acetyltransferase [Desulfovibrio sp. OttesenSCG-928-C06]|nr:NeuD/PglB/VioB family sugar acetyltransferase [Desulfovibrio sp. OttesenSCG-928-C06]
MDNCINIVMPQLNPNENKVYLAWNRTAGDAVLKGDSLASLETTKNVEDLLAPESGYFFPLVEDNAKYPVGNILGIITQSRSIDVSKLLDVQHIPSDNQHPAQLTRKAREYAMAQGIDLSLLPKNVLLKEEDVRRWQNHNKNEPVSQLEKLKEILVQCPDYRDALIVLGGGGAAKLVIETIRAQGIYSIVGILEQDCYDEDDEILGIPVIKGDDDEILQYLFTCGVHKACNAVVSYYDLTARDRIHARLTRIGFELPTIIHPTAHIEKGVAFGDGVFVHAQAYIGTNCIIGNNVFVNTRALISHDCIVGDTVFFAPNAVLGGSVSIGNQSVIGMCATILSEVQIGNNVFITNGANISTNIQDGQVISPQRKVE